MGGCRCSYRTCKSATKISGELHFFHYPVKHKERCQQWINNARKPEFLNLPDDQLRNKVVCNLHFEARYFTNIQRKRLVHDAVPTLNVGCEDESMNESMEYKDINVLPANADGTIFTVDTDSLQQKLDDDSICTYSLRNGTIIPVYTENSDVEQVVYTIVENDVREINSNHEKNTEKRNFLYVSQQHQQAGDNEYVSNFNGHICKEEVCDTSVSESVPETQVTNIDLVNQEEETMEVVYITEHSEQSDMKEESVNNDSGIVLQKNGSKNKKNVKNFGINRLRRNLIRQMKVHSKEITSIKRALLFNGLRVSKSISPFKLLKGIIPPTLFGALTLHLHKKKSNFSKNEIEFLKIIYSYSPDLYNTFSQKLSWNLPGPSIIQEILNIPDD